MKDVHAPRAGRAEPKGAMFKLVKPATRTSSVLNDPRSTGSAVRPRLADILGLRGTKRG